MILNRKFHSLVCVQTCNHLEGSRRVISVAAILGGRLRLKGPNLDEDGPGD